MPLLQMVDANQRWDAGQAVTWMRELAPCRPLWIEEPTSPDDVLGHKAITDAPRPLGSPRVLNFYLNQLMTE